MSMSRRKEINKKRIAIIEEMNEQNRKRCDQCRLGDKKNNFTFDCCDAARRIKSLGDELLNLKGKSVGKKDTLEYKDMRKKYRAIAEKNGIKYTTFMTRLEAGYPMDVSATYTQEALRKWRERNDKQNSISGKTDQGS